MNCPSRTDVDYENPDWNQNPPFLAADLTTCQDLNGMVNARETKRDTRALNHPLDEDLDDAYQSTQFEACPEPSCSSFRGWAWWLASVLCTSILLSNINVFNFSNIRSLFDTLWKGTTATNGPSRTQFTKRDTCASGGVTKDYNTPLHVAALFIILFVSTTGCAFPMIVLKFPRLRIPAKFLFTARHFGTGVLAATAFVHLLPGAFISLGDPCLPDFWTSDYPSMPGAIVLAAIFLLALIEMTFSPGRSVCSGGHGDIEKVPRERTKRKGTAKDQARAPARPTLPTVVEGSSPLRDLGPLYGRRSSFSRTLARLGEQSEQLDQMEMAQREQRAQEPETDDTSDSSSSENSQGPFTLTKEQKHRRAVMQCNLLEMGILFHSVFIGMSLSVSIGSEFVVLLIAIIFHQTFEGLALGARIASLDWPENAYQPWIMAFTYGCTTPIGQAIGLATHSLYSPDSEVGLLLVGIMSAISAGFLVWASLVELLSEDFLSDESWRILRGKRRVWACVLVFLGAFSMSLVGAWA